MSPLLAVDYVYTTETTTTSGGLSPLVLVLMLVLVVVTIAGVWKTFEKANRSGWMSIIPILNSYVLIRMAKKPGWWILLYLIPFVNIIVWAIVALELAKAFGKSTAFGIIGLFLFAPIGFLMLGFGDAKYK